MGQLIIMRQFRQLITMQHLDRDHHESAQAIDRHASVQVVDNHAAIPSVDHDIFRQ